MPHLELQLRQLVEETTELTVDHPTLQRLARQVGISVHTLLQIAERQKYAQKREGGEYSGWKSLGYIQLPGIGKGYQRRDGWFAATLTEDGSASAVPAHMDVRTLPSLLPQAVDVQEEAATLGLEFFETGEKLNEQYQATAARPPEGHCCDGTWG